MDLRGMKLREVLRLLEGEKGGRTAGLHEACQSRGSMIG